MLVKGATDDISYISTWPVVAEISNFKPNYQHTQNVPAPVLLPQSRLVVLCLSLYPIEMSWNGWIDKSATHSENFIVNVYLEHLTLLRPKRCGRQFVGVLKYTFGKANCWVSLQYMCQGSIKQKSTTVSYNSSLLNWQQHYLKTALSRFLR